MVVEVIKIVDIFEVVGVVNDGNVVKIFDIVEVVGCLDF